MKRFEELSEAGFTLSAPMGAMLHVSDFPELELVQSMPEGLEKRAGGEEGFRAFLELLRDFAEQSQFAEFRRDNRSLYEGLLEGTLTIQSSSATRVVGSFSFEARRGTVGNPQIVNVQGTFNATNTTPAGM